MHALASGHEKLFRRAEWATVHAGCAKGGHLPKSPPGQTPMWPKRHSGQDRHKHDQGDRDRRCGWSHRSWDQIKSPAFDRALSSREQAAGIQSSAGRYPLISRPMQISTSVEVVQVMRILLWVPGNQLRHFEPRDQLLHIRQAPRAPAPVLVLHCT
jgi:hypothetical protein